jgi:hypothetical protein
VARAKRTDRAEARRRYRAEMAGPDDLGEEVADGEGGPAQTPTPNAGRSRPSTARPSAPTGRLGIAAAFRQSIHPLNVRGDLAALPGLVTNKALYIPVLLTVGSTVLVLATGATNFLTALMFTYFIQSPAIGGVFIAGFLAPRASWLLGVIVGLVSAAGYSAVLLSGVVNGTAGAPTEAQARDVIISAFFVSPVMGGLFAAGAAWYRRFLQLSNPNRGRQGQAKRGGGGGGGGRSRSSGTAKPR